MRDVLDVQSTTKEIAEWATAAPNVELLALNIHSYTHPVDHSSFGRENHGCTPMLDYWNWFWLALSLFTQSPTPSFPFAVIDILPFGVDVGVCDDGNGKKHMVLSSMCELSCMQLYVRYMQCNAARVWEYVCWKFVNKIGFYSKRNASPKCNAANKRIRLNPAWMNDWTNMLFFSNVLRSIHFYAIAVATGIDAKRWMYHLVNDYY